MLDHNGAMSSGVEMGVAQTTVTPSLNVLLEAFWFACLFLLWFGLLWPLVVALLMTPYFLWLFVMYNWFLRKWVQKKNA